jgi:replication factor C subunit 2/4
MPLIDAMSLQQAVLELNASDSRGIDVVRSKIKMFAQKKVTLPPGLHKIVILDEADSMTANAQQALRRTMEIFSSTTRFALACNISSKIIEPIQSRCAILRFSRLSDADVLLRLQQVCAKEHVTYTRDGLEALLFTAEVCGVACSHPGRCAVDGYFSHSSLRDSLLPRLFPSQGDMRNALNNLQSTHAGFQHVDQINVLKVCDQPHPQTVLEILENCKSMDMRGAIDKMKFLYDQGYSANDLIGTVFKVCRDKLDVDEGMKLEFLKVIGFTHMQIADGVTSLLQLLGLCARLCRTSQEMGQ